MLLMTNIMAAIITEITMIVIIGMLVKINMNVIIIIIIIIILTVAIINIFCGSPSRYNYTLVIGSLAGVGWARGAGPQ